MKNLSPETPLFNPDQVTEIVTRDPIVARGSYPSDFIRQVVDEVAEGAKVTNFVTTVTIRKLRGNAVLGLPILPQQPPESTSTPSSQT